MEKVIRQADRIFRLARWVRGMKDAAELIGSGKSYVALYFDGKNVFAKPLEESTPVFNNEMTEGEVSDCISIMCESGAVSGIMTIGDALVAADASPNETATIERLVNLGVDAHLIADSVPCAHHVLSAVLYGKGGIRMTYNSPIESCTVFNQMVESVAEGEDESTPREFVRSLTNRLDPFSETIGDFSALWWRCQPINGIEMKDGIKRKDFICPENEDALNWN